MAPVVVSLRLSAPGLLPAVNTVTLGYLLPAVNTVTSGYLLPAVRAVTSGYLLPAVNTVTSGYLLPAVHAVTSGYLLPAVRAVTSGSGQKRTSIKAHSSLAYSTQLSPTKHTASHSGSPPRLTLGNLKWSPFKMAAPLDPDWSHLPLVPRVVSPEAYCPPKAHLGKYTPCITLPHCFLPWLATVGPRGKLGVPQCVFTYMYVHVYICVCIFKGCQTITNCNVINHKVS